MGLTVITAPAGLPVSLAEQKLHSRVDATADDTLIPRLVSAATDYCQSTTGQQLCAAVLEQTFDRFPADGILRLTRLPVLSIVSIRYTAADDTDTLIDADDYELIADDYGAQVRPALGLSWPSARAIANSVRVRFVAGTADAVTVNASTNTLTSNVRTFANGDVVRVAASGGADAALPTGLAVDTDYYVVGASGKTFGLATAAGGSAIDLTTAGTGTVYVYTGQPMSETLRAAVRLLAGHWYERREPIIVGAIQAEISFALDALLAMNRVFV